GGGVIVKTSQDFFVSGLTFWEKIQTKKTYATIVGGLTLGFILLIIFMNIYNIKLLKKNTTLLRKNRTSLNNLIRK
ncbi:MAG TPA: hypothetical protein VJC39_00005, partial [Candidatus Nanoarchaeia archaeon]|nr:hypothetical protein [Candidatus Nanoarchaeia archaeon]